VRLYFLQIVKGQYYYEKSDSQYTGNSASSFDRGDIFFDSKDGYLVSAATVKKGYIIAINPSVIQANKSLDKVFEDLSTVITLDKESFYFKANKLTDPYEEIARKISEEQMNKISSKKIDGVIISKDSWRIYPGGQLASNTLGFVGYNDNKLEGRYGLEKYYQDTLKREDNKVFTNVFAEIFSNIKKISEDSDREGDLVTSIDPEVQNALERTVGGIENSWSSKITGGIVIDPKTGEVYAMSVSPTFDLNDFSKEKKVGVFSNPLISDSYEMGSIIKPLTIASGIDSGAITAKTTYNDTGFIMVDGKKISNHDGLINGVSDMQEVLSKSLNVGAAFVVNKMGKEKFLEYFKNLEIGTETGIDLPNEAAGSIENLNSPRDIEFVTASFGQGISMTPINVVRALSTLANGGKLITPHIVKKINYEVGLSKNISFVNEAKQVFRKDTTEEVTRLLIGAVDKALLGGKLKQTNYSIAAKTGTAQMARPIEDGGGYYPDKYLHSFFGYFPAYNPRFLIFLYTVEPKSLLYASDTLAEPFLDVVKFLINYYEIPPDR
jgi:cell division protein FtsI/penicillin-binding protein 2